MNVRKSDNSTEEFSVDKVKRGVCEAYGSVGEECPEALIDSLSKNLYIYENIQTSEIRRQVEECLMSINKKVAKAYIAKNEERDANGKILKNKNDIPIGNAELINLTILLLLLLNKVTIAPELIFPEMTGMLA